MRNDYHIVVVGFAVVVLVSGGGGGRDVVAAIVELIHKPCYFCWEFHPQYAIYYLNRLHMRNFDVAPAVVRLKLFGNVLGCSGSASALTPDTSINK